MNEVRIAIVGFGNAAKSFSKILLAKNEHIISKYNIRPIITAIATQTRASIISDKALDINYLLNAKNYFAHPDSITITTRDLIKQADYDLLIELTPLNIKNGMPAIDYIKLAMERGKHVITANKGPLAHAYQELLSLSKENNVKFLFETTVMDGTPIFNLVENTLPFCKVLAFEGILNTTTNFILSEMEKGFSKEEALVKARAQGFVESNPDNDLKGFDAAAKIAVLVNVLMNKSISPQAVLTEGIENIYKEDILKAKTNKQQIKLFCQAKLVDGSVFAEVRPRCLDKRHPLAAIEGTSSAITLKTDLMKDITIIENSPEIGQTGYGIFSDFISLIRSF